MSYFKSLLISLIALVVFTPIMLLIAYAIGGNFDGLISAMGNGMYLLYVLFSSTGHAIWILINSMIYAVETSFSLLVLLVNLSFIIAPLIAAIITGRFSDNRVHSLVGFLFSTIICMLICLILVYSASAYAIQIGGTFNESQAIMNVVLGSLVNGIIYGLIAFITTKK